MLLSGQRIVEFRRQTDAVCYRFVPTAEMHGHLAWKREDLPLWLVRLPVDGWVVVDVADTILSRPSTALPSAQGELPPNGPWVSKKDDRSYLYDLVFV
jgi:hypothetical protein